MLRSELYELEVLVSAILKETGTGDQNSYQKLIIERVAYVKTQCSDLKKKWTRELLSNAKEQIIKRYVQYHEAGIIQLSDEVSRYVNVLDFSPAIRKTQVDAYTMINAELENLIDFLRVQCYIYFDIDHKATIYYCQLQSIKIAAFIPDLNNYQGNAVDPTLITAVMASIDDLTAEGLFSGISYRQADQALNILRMSHHLLLFGTNPTTDSLVRALFHQNCNSLHFYNWYQEQMLSKLLSIGDKNEQQFYLNGQIKIFSGIFVSPEKALQSELRSTDTFLIPWLQGQLSPENKRTQTKPGKVQMPLNLSVPQFALFVRIFYKTGCFSIENVAMITRFFSDNFTTKKQPHISNKSFGRAFYNLDQSAAAIVRDFLQKMLNYLNKTYFP